MDDNQDVHNQVCNAEDVGVVGFGLGPGKELHHSADSQKLVDSNLRVVEAKVQVQDVSGKHGNDIKTKLEAGDVAVSEELLIFHQQALFQVTCTQRRPKTDQMDPLSADYTLMRIVLEKATTAVRYRFWS